MAHYRKKATVEAVKWNGENIDEINEFSKYRMAYIDVNNEFGIISPEGFIRLNVGDYIIKDEHGKFGSCEATTFEQKYTDDDCAGCDVSAVAVLLRQENTRLRELLDRVRDAWEAYLTCVAPDEEIGRYRAELCVVMEGLEGSGD